MGLFSKLLERLRPGLAHCTIRFWEPVPLGTRLAVTSWFLATGDSYANPQYALCINEASVSYISPDICRTIFEEYTSEVLVCPTTKEERTEVAPGFSHGWQFHNCFGALHGKHVAVKSPCKSVWIFCPCPHRPGWCQISVSVCGHWLSRQCLQCWCRSSMQPPREDWRHAPWSSLILPPCPMMMALSVSFWLWMMILLVGLGRSPSWIMEKYSIILSVVRPTTQHMKLSPSMTTSTTATAVILVEWHGRTTWFPCESPFLQTAFSGPRNAVLRTFLCCLFECINSLQLLPTFCAERCLLCCQNKTCSVVVQFIGRKMSTLLPLYIKLCEWLFSGPQIAGGVHFCFYC